MKTLTGIVISNKMDKTVNVLVEYMWQHPVYKKRIKKNNKYLAHSEDKIKEGQKVVIGETKPISKNKSWRVIEIIK